MIFYIRFSRRDTLLYTAVQITLNRVRRTLHKAATVPQREKNRRNVFLRNTHAYTTEITTTCLSVHTTTTTEFEMRKIHVYRIIIQQWKGRSIMDIDQSSHVAVELSWVVGRGGRIVSTIWKSGEGDAVANNTSHHQSSEKSQKIILDILPKNLIFSYASPHLHRCFRMNWKIHWVSNKNKKVQQQPPTTTTTNKQQ